MPDVYVIRSEGGKYTSNFIEGGYVAGGWIPEQDLSAVTTREQIHDLYRASDPNLSPRALGSYVQQTALFLLDMKPGDYVITPAVDSQQLYYGRLEASPTFYSPNDAECLFPHRRKVAWVKKPVNRLDFPVQFQYTMRASKTAFRVRSADEFLAKIGELRPAIPATDSRKVVIDQVLTLHDKEFEELIGELLEAIGFPAEVTGKSGDGGVDVEAELIVPKLARAQVHVQVKRYRDQDIKAKDIERLRQAAEQRGGQGAFITTSKFNNGAKKSAEKEPRIGLIDGYDLADLLVEHWAAISEDFQARLRLRPGLVPS